MRAQQMLKVTRIAQKKVRQLSILKIEKIKKIRSIGFRAYNKAREAKGIPLDKKYLFSEEENNYRAGVIIERFKKASMLKQ